MVCVKYKEWLEAEKNGISEIDTFKEGSWMDESAEGII